LHPSWNPKKTSRRTSMCRPHGRKKIEPKRREIGKEKGSCGAVFDAGKIVVWQTKKETL